MTQGWISKSLKGTLYSHYKMGSLGLKVRSLFMKLNRQEKIFLGGPPYSEEIEREFLNFKKYKINGLPDRRRICLGTYIIDDNGTIIGYQASTIMQSANPTSYETENLGLRSLLDYVQLKKILVDPDYFGKGISDQLLEQSLGLASKHNKDWVVDINSSNERMIHLLAKRDISKRKEWETPKKTVMYRFGI